MQTVSQYEPQSDEVLAEQAGRGDREAFTSLYQRHSRGVFDLAVRVVRDPDVAADVVQDTFVKAWQSLPKRKGPQHVKAWLYTIARNSAIDEYRSASHFVSPGPDSDSSASSAAYAVVDTDRAADPEASVEDREVAELVWSSAAALNPREYTLLDLHLRKGLTPDELATSFGLQKGAVYTMLSRLRNSLEDSVASTLLMRRGRRECPELDAVLSQMRPGQSSAERQRLVSRHLDHCSRCQENKRRYTSPVEIFSALTLVPLGDGDQEALWARISSQTVPAIPNAGASASLTEGAVRWWAGMAMANKVILIAILPAIAGLLLAASLFIEGAGGNGAPLDPDDVYSASHQIAVPSGNNAVVVRWSNKGDAAAYAVRWSQLAHDLPNVDTDQAGLVTEASSPLLAEGDWYFHLRTRGRNGAWTSTVHLGPFLIRLPTTVPALIAPTPPPQAIPSATGTPSPTGTVTSTPTATQASAVVESPPEAPMAANTDVPRGPRNTPQAISTPRPPSDPTQEPSVTYPQDSGRNSATATTTVRQTPGSTRSPAVTPLTPILPTSLATSTAAVAPKILIVGTIVIPSTNTPTFAPLYVVPLPLLPVRTPTPIIRID